MVVIASKPAPKETEGAIAEEALNIRFSSMEKPLRAKRGVDISGKSMAQEKPTGPDDPPTTLAHAVKKQSGSSKASTLAHAAKEQRGSSKASR